MLLNSESTVTSLILYNFIFPIMFPLSLLCLASHAELYMYRLMLALLCNCPISFAVAALDELLSLAPITD